MCCDRLLWRAMLIPVNTPGDGNKAAEEFEGFVEVTKRLISRHLELAESLRQLIQESNMYKQRQRSNMVNDSDLSCIVLVALQFIVWHAVECAVCCTQTAAEIVRREYPLFLGRLRAIQVSASLLVSA